MPEREPDDLPPPSVAIRNEWSSTSACRTQEHKCFYWHHPGFVLCNLFRTDGSDAL